MCRCDLNGHNLLGKLYEDPARWSFQFQSYVQLTRLRLLKSPTRLGVKVVERSIQNNRFCFLELARRAGTMTEAELAVLAGWYDFLDRTMRLDLDLIVYLRASPEVAYERMRSRARKEEAGAPLVYLEAVHTAYEEWLVEQAHGKVEVEELKLRIVNRRQAFNPRTFYMQVPILILDANKSKEEMIATYERYQDVIRGKKKLDPGQLLFDGAEAEAEADALHDPVSAKVPQVDSNTSGLTCC